MVLTDVRFETDCFPITRLGFRETTTVSECVTKVAVRIGIVGFETGRFPKTRFGFRNASEVFEHHAEVVVRLGVMRTQSYRLTHRL